MDIGDHTADLDLIGGIYGTDKSSADHNYLVHYDKLFKQHRSLLFNFWEIGIFRGASLATWQEYFTKATIVGIDIQESCRQFARDRVVVESGSQEDPGFLSDMVRRYPPRIIIDDGSHKAHHVIFSFETLFPAIEPGGIYVVEDLHFHTGAMREHSRGHSEVNPIDYFMSLARMIVGGDLEADKRWGFLGYAFQFINEIVFFGKAVAIHKKATRSDQRERLSAVMEIAEKAATREAWERASQYLAGNRSNDLAIKALQRAIECEPLARLFRHLSRLHYANAITKPPLRRRDSPLPARKSSTSVANALNTLAICCSLPAGPRRPFTPLRKRLKPIATRLFASGSWRKSIAWHDGGLVAIRWQPARGAYWRNLRVDSVAVRLWAPLSAPLALAAHPLYSEQ